MPGPLDIRHANERVPARGCDLVTTSGITGLPQQALFPFCSSRIYQFELDCESPWLLIIRNIFLRFIDDLRNLISSYGCFILLCLYGD